ncbi:thylakoid protein translocator TATC (nucleomorph) [Lotharella oceanica]|uniref:Thylakoid protein translocator TATC n=1 Tax=Lotharella oceanica TaxID=641309 RepID=A0A060DHN8_9EUKA|nr:thylakoid protein translocator TATC [Lotharella oceanica]
MIINKNSNYVINNIRNSKLNININQRKKNIKCHTHVIIRKNKKYYTNIFVYNNKINFKYHLTELKDRVKIAGFSSILSLILCLFYSKEIIKIIQIIGLKKNVSFLQISPGDFFFTSIDIGLYFGVLCAIPSILYQITSYVIPGLTIREKNFFVLITISSIVLFLLGTIFSFNILSPYALNFFLNYSENSVEATISIKQYFEFFIELFFITGIAFQLPIFQLIFVKSKIISLDSMKRQWRVVFLAILIISSIITPTTDPLTLLLISFPLFFLYIFGILLVKYIK